MVHYVRLEEGRVVEEIELPDGINPADVYHPSLVIMAAPVSVTRGWTYDGKAFKEPVVSTPSKEELAEYARLVSYRKRVGGMVYQDLWILTDSDTLALINGLKLMADAQPDRVFNFDTPNGTMPLTAEQANALALAVGEFVQSTFDRRAEVLSGIEAGDITKREEIEAAFASL